MPRQPNRSLELGAYVRELRAKRNIQQVADAAGISHSRWRQIEGGDIPPANTLWEVARALGATASQIERLFELAMFDEMFEHMVRIGQSRAPGMPGTAELGITTDPTLTPEAKAKALDYLQMLRQHEDQ